MCTGIAHSVMDLQPGDHLCCIYESEEQHRELLTPFLRQGLEQHQKVLYIVDAHTAETVLSYLKDVGMDVESCLQSGQFSILSVGDAYMKYGVFDPDKMIELLRTAVDEALEEGYTALRATGEMTWALRGFPGSERLIEYESKLNNFFTGSAFLAICQYDRRRFSPELLLDVIATHPIVVRGTEVYENFYYMPPEEFLGPGRSGAMLQRWLDNISARQQIEEERKRLTDEVQRQATEAQHRAAELSAVNQELESFAYSVSHDLRAPLRHMDGFSNLLLQEYADKLDEEGQEYLRFVSNASRQMNQLIDGLLTLSRVTRYEIRRQQVDLSGMASTIAQELRDSQPERQVQFDIAAGLVENGDERLVKILIENLLGNAWKFTSKRPVARIQFGVLFKDGKNVYFVRDNGAGFDAAHADKLFGAFQRLHSEADYSGNGIGLATVKRIVHRHGGYVWAEGEVDKGAVFYFTLS